MCIKAIKKLFQKRHREVEEAAAPPPKPKRKTWFERMKDHFPSFHFIATSRGGLNMPRYQPCPYPDCRKNSKRTSKTMGGAYYRCPNHGGFFVKAP